MKYTPEQYEWEQGDIVVASDFDEVLIRTNNGWKSTARDSNPPFSDNSITRWVKDKNYKFVTNRREVYEEDW